VRTSFLVPVYNRVDMLPDTLDSILAQTDEDWECVIVDGASTDGTVEVIREYCGADGRFRAIYQPENKGYLPDFRRCVDEAKGEFGKFVYSDDTIESTYLEATLPWMTEDVGFVYTAARIGSTPQDSRVAYVHPKAPAKIARNDYLTGAMVDSPHFPVSPGAAIFRSDDLRKNQLSPGDFLEEKFPCSGTDLLLYLLTADDYPFVVALPEPLAFFRAHPDSVSIAEPAQVQAGYLAARMWFRGQA
jgi:glycosyltransferase involved in cell wall biosynthesis